MTGRQPAVGPSRAVARPRGRVRHSCAVKKNGAGPCMLHRAGPRLARTATVLPPHTTAMAIRLTPDLTTRTSFSNSGLSGIFTVFTYEIGFRRLRQTRYASLQAFL